MIEELNDMQNNINQLQQQLYDAIHQNKVQKLSFEAILHQLEEKLNNSQLQVKELTLENNRKDDIIVKVTDKLDQIDSCYQDLLLSNKQDLENQSDDYTLKMTKCDALLAKETVYVDRIKDLELELQQRSESATISICNLEKQHILEKKELNDYLTTRVNDAIKNMDYSKKNKASDSILSSLQENKKLEQYTFELLELTKTLTSQNKQLMVDIDKLKIK